MKLRLSKRADAAGRDVSAVDLLRVEINPREHEVTSSYKACLVCTISLDGEDPFHWYKMLPVIGGHDEWEALVKNFNAHKYTVTDCTDKEFVGINITHDEEYNYYMV